MRLKAMKIIAIATLCGLLGGCSDAAEPDTLGYVVAIGVDKPVEGGSDYDITLQFANASKISGGSSEEGGKGGGESIDNITVSAPGIYAAVNIANHIISKTFVLSHTKLIVFSEEICREGINSLLDTIGRSSDIRPNTYFAMSRCRAKEFLEAVNPETEVNPVRYYTMIFENDFSGFIPQNMYGDFYFFYNSEEKSTGMPLCSVAEQPGTHNFSDTGYQEGLHDYKAGEITAEKAETQVMGMAIFDGDKFKYEIGDIETEMYNILTGQYKRGYSSYRYEEAEKGRVSVRQELHGKPKIRVDTSGEAPQISIELKLEADFASPLSQDPEPDALARFERAAEEDLKREINEFLKKTTEMGTDIVGFGSYAKRNFGALQEFESYHWKEKYKNAGFDVQVSFSLRRTGLIVRS